MIMFEINTRHWAIHPKFTKERVCPYAELISNYKINYIMLLSKFDTISFNIYVLKF